MFIYKAQNLSGGHHGFFGRDGYEGFENRVRCHQVHGSAVVYVGEEWNDLCMPKADGLVTDQSDIPLAIITADCAPVLLADKINGVIGAAHAGWRGAFEGVVENTIRMMIEKGAEAKYIDVAIGPCIAQPSYEVDQVFYDQFVGANTKTAQFFIPSKQAGHHMFDLAGYISWRIYLVFSDIGSVSLSPHDTYSEDPNFYSHRRATHQGRAKTETGRQFSIVTLNG